MLPVLSFSGIQIYKSLRLLALASSIVLSLGACESKNSDSNSLTASEDDLSDVEIYKSASPYANIIPDCIRAEDSADACQLSRLPLLGMESDTITIEQVMNRVVVSHDWMGDRFEEVLLTLPDELIQLFRGTTAIVIDDDIRPAYYTVATGAIYLDANFFWLTRDEVNTVNPKEDPRSSFDDPLAFRSLFRYLLNNERAYRYLAPDNYQARSLDDIRLLVASLLLHELAHANDFFPPNLHNSIDANDRPWPAAQKQESLWVSTRLNAMSPLTSDLMYNLGRVMFRGDTATAAQRDITAAEVGAEYEPDGAADDYGYSSIREDVAMLFEEAMMKRLFSLDRDQAFTTAPGATNTCSEYLIGWGVRNRYNESHVVPRAEFVLNQILPEINFDDFLRDSPAPTPLPNDVSWCDSLDAFDNSASSSQQKPSNDSLIESFDLRPPYL